MLPFNKRSRMSSAIEIGTEELEAIELPQVRPPSVRPGVQQHRPTFASFEDEMTIVRPDKRVSTSPPPRANVIMPRIPQSYAPRFDDSYPRYEREAAAYERRRRADEEPTMLHPSSTSQRPLLSMSSPHVRSVIVEEEQRPRRRHHHHEVPPPAPASSRAVVTEEPPRSSAAVDASASSSHMRAVDMSMTASLSGSTDVRKMRPSFGWAAGLLAVGVFAGLVAAVAAKGDGLSSIASLVDPSHVTADVSHAAGAQPQQAPMTVAPLPGAAAPQAVSMKPAAPSCNADAVAPAAKPAVQAQPVAKAAEPVQKEVVVVKAEPKQVVAVAAPVWHPAPVVHHVDAPPPVVHEHHAAPPAAPVAHAVSHRHHGDEMESASAADELAKAQLDAALTR